MYRNEKVVPLYEGERIDDLQRNGYGIIQASDAFCFGMDAVLLSGFAKVRRGERAVDLCTGTGIIPLLLEAKSEGEYYYGIEIQPEAADRAQRSVELNGLENKISILCKDIRELPAEKAVDLKGRMVCLGNGGTDVVTVNPPYIKINKGLQNSSDKKTIARHELCCTLEDVCRSAAALLRSGGRLYMVHRPQRLAEIIFTLKEKRLEPKRLKFVHPFADHEANMVLIEAAKDGGSECRVEKPLIVYASEGKYTDEIYDLYGY